MTTMNISDYAKHADVNRKTITRWIKAGKYIVMTGDDIDVEASNANLERYRKTVTRPAKKAAGNTQGNRSSGNRSGNKKEKDSAEPAAKVIERMIAENGVTMMREECQPEDRF